MGVPCSSFGSGDIWGIGDGIYARGGATTFRAVFGFRDSENLSLLGKGLLRRGGVIHYPLAKLNEQKGRSRFKIEGTEKEAETHFKCLAQYQLPIPVSRYDAMRLSWVEVTPKQGRKHQIRRHFKHQLHPLVGDSCYGCRHINKVTKDIWPEDFRLMLHASSLRFSHPITGETMTIKAELSDEILNVLNKLLPYQA